MDVSINRNDAGIELALKGNLDTKGSVELQKAMDEICGDGAALNLIVNFTSVPFVSSAGLRVLLLTMKKLNAAGGGMELTNVSDPIREVFNMTGFSSILKIN